jgi:hypothetical protein
MPSMPPTPSPPGSTTLWIGSISEGVDEYKVRRFFERSAVQSVRYCNCSNCNTSSRSSRPCSAADVAPAALISCRYGAVERVTLHPASSGTDQYAFVTFSRASDASTALGELDGVVWDGITGRRPFKIEISRSVLRKNQGVPVQPDPSSSESVHKGRGPPRLTRASRWCTCRVALAPTSL